MKTRCKTRHGVVEDTNLLLVLMLRAHSHVTGFSVDSYPQNTRWQTIFGRGCGGMSAGPNLCMLSFKVRVGILCIHLVCNQEAWSTCTALPNMCGAESSQSAGLYLLNTQILGWPGSSPYSVILALGYESSLITDHQTCKLSLTEVWMMGCWKRAEQSFLMGRVQGVPPLQSCWVKWSCMPEMAPKGGPCVCLPPWPISLLLLAMPLCDAMQCCTAPFYSAAWNGSEGGPIAHLPPRLTGPLTSTHL